ncbi:hypothetical protein N0V86_009434 [Didymella sp. IMI 355093]|nr:hypothetical protein N0V86_009434 [Didymella sp. IMI 355093]
MEELLDPVLGGALADKHDKHDHYYQKPPTDDLPSKVNLRTDMKRIELDIYQQYDTNSCTANAAAAAFWYEQIAVGNKATWEHGGPSRRFIYWLARGGDRTTRSPGGDGGSCMRDAIKGLARLGVCVESECPFPDLDVEYDDLKDDKSAAATQEKKRRKNKALNEKPIDAAFDSAAAHRITRYLRLDADMPHDAERRLTMQQRAVFGQYNLDMLRHCLSEGYPVAFSFRFYFPAQDMFDQRLEGMRILKDPWENGPFPRNTYPEELYTTHPALTVPHGAHSVLAIGYDDEQQQVLIQNSRGSAWGKHGGLFLMPYNWISDVAATYDFWTIRLGGEGPEMTPLFWRKLFEQLIEAAFRIAGDQ